MIPTTVRETLPATQHDNRFASGRFQSHQAGRGNSRPPQDAAHAGNFPAPAEMRRKRRLTRPMAPFLAQLSLQYDDIAIARRKRRERQEAAARSYYATDASTDTCVPGLTRDLRT